MERGGDGNGDGDGEGGSRVREGGAENADLGEDSGRMSVFILYFWRGGGGGC